MTRPLSSQKTASIVCVGVLAITSIGAAFAVTRPGIDPSASAAAAANANRAQQPNQQAENVSPGSESGSGDAQEPQSPAPSPTDDTTSNTGVGQATEAQMVGVVDIVTEVNFGQGQAAGTGVLLSADGEILTNNHVIDGATSIQIVVLSTGETYEATVTGTSASNDIAVLQIADVDGLPVAVLGDSADIAVGDPVVGVGNTGNEPGTTAAPGEITALDQTVTAANEGGENPAQLDGLIQTNAAIAAGDSGGPLYDGDGTIIGINTAAQTTGGDNPVTVAGFAIPIDDAVELADQILAGEASAEVRIGLPAFLGIQQEQGAAQTGAGVTIVGVVPDSAAARAGLTAGDTITAIDGQTVTDIASLQAVLEERSPGDSVSLNWIDVAGNSQVATVELGSGPA